MEVDLHSSLGVVPPSPQLAGQTLLEVGLPFLQWVVEVVVLLWLYVVLQHVLHIRLHIVLIHSDEIWPLEKQLAVLAAQQIFLVEVVILNSWLQRLSHIRQRFYLQDGMPNEREWQSIDLTVVYIRLH